MSFQALRALEFALEYLDLKLDESLTDFQVLSAKSSWLSRDCSSQSYYNGNNDETDLQTAVSEADHGWLRIQLSDTPGSKVCRGT